MILFMAVIMQFEDGFSWFTTIIHDEDINIESYT